MNKGNDFESDNRSIIKPTSIDNSVENSKRVSCIRSVILIFFKKGEVIRLAGSRRENGADHEQAKEFGRVS